MCPQLGPLTGPYPWVLPCYTHAKGVYLTPKCATFVVYVSHFSPRAWLRTAFTDVGPKVLVSYYGHSYGARILCGAYPGEGGKVPPPPPCDIPSGCYFFMGP